MQRPESIILVAEDPAAQMVGLIVGRASLEIGSPLGASAEIYNIGTRPFIRKTGVGSQLLRRFLEVCESRGAIQVWLEVRAFNYEAKAFYSSHGFLISAIRRNFYTAPVEDAELMYLDLSR